MFTVEPGEEAQGQANVDIDIDKYIDEMPDAEQLRKVLNALDNTGK